ncbi:uncharacterized protein BDV14DRAFT_197473 [Aspergillus stella-maris]|uniref:uncharacterized protein n=1 Tax=Aspergillus stella-maris TaxID=1810926 RepID=UPI003CCCF020
MGHCHPYRTASRDWVSEVLIGLAPNTRAPFVPALASWDDVNDLWERLFLKVGSDKKLDGLVIAEREMNLKKANFLGRARVAASNNADEELTRNRHRNTAGVFWYMRDPTVWAIFIDASQGIEVALQEFDDE